MTSSHLLWATETAEARNQIETTFTPTVARVCPTCTGNMVVYVAQEWGSCELQANNLPPSIPKISVCPLLTGTADLTLGLGALCGRSSAKTTSWWWWLLLVLPKVGVRRRFSSSPPPASDLYSFEAVIVSKVRFRESYKVSWKGHTKMNCGHKRGRERVAGRGVRPCTIRLRLEETADEPRTYVHCGLRKAPGGVRAVIVHYAQRSDYAVAPPTACCS